MARSAFNGYRPRRRMFSWARPGGGFDPLERDEARIRRRARRAWFWRNRWKLYPAYIAMATGVLDWLCLLARKLDAPAYAWSSAALLAAVGSAVGALWLRRTRDRVYTAVVTAYLIGWLLAVTYWWMPLASFWWKLALFPAGTALGWIPVAVPYWWHYRIREKYGLVRHHEAWARIAEGIGIPGAHLPWSGLTIIRKDGEYIGEDYWVRLRAGQNIADINVGRAMSHFDVPTGGTVIPELVGKLDDNETATTVRDIKIRVIRRNPWKRRESTVPHPLLENLDAIEAHLAAIAGEKGVVR